jgi:OmpR family response regulator RpaB
VFSRDDILNQLRGHEAELYTRAVDIVVSRLRKKLEPLDCIKTCATPATRWAWRRWHARSMAESRRQRLRQAHHALRHSWRHRCACA